MPDFTPSSREIQAVPLGPADNQPAMKKLAAIDIGTNSIKLLVAAVDEGGVLEVLSREKSSVRLGSETLSTGRLAPGSGVLRAPATVSRNEPGEIDSSRRQAAVHFGRPPLRPLPTYRYEALRE